MTGIVGFLKSSDVRAIAVLTDECVPSFEDIPTAKEQGIDVVTANWRGLYFPRSTCGQNACKKVAVQRNPGTLREVEETWSSGHEQEEMPTRAFPFSPPEMRRGAIYEFCLNHVRDLHSPLEAFQLSLEDISTLG